MEGISLRAGITIGDPAGIGPEVALKAVNELTDERIVPVIIGRLEVLTGFYGDLVSGYTVVEASRCRESSFSSPGKYILDVPVQRDIPRPGSGNAGTGAESLQYIDTMLDLWKRHFIDLVVTGPVSKGHIQRSGVPFRGHTEYIAEAIGEQDPRMMMFSKEFRVLLVTTHIPVAAVAGAVRLESIAATIREAHRAMSSIDGGEIRVAVAGLDPHCGDDGAIGTFDRDVTTRAVEICRNEGINVEGPFAADTLFLPDRWKRYNIIIAQYHDQGLIPFKALAFDTGVNVTLGLSITRTSVDHGTAFDIAGRGEASHGSMTEAIRLGYLLESGKRAAR